MPFRDIEVEAVIFDWGGTLSTFATSVRVEELWDAAAAATEPHAPHSQQQIAASLAATEDAFWERTATHQRAGTLSEIVAEAHQRLGADVPAHALEAAALAYLEAWAPHIEHDVEAAATLEALRAAGIRVAMLSNTHWPRAYHERFLARDGLVELIDVRFYTSEMTHMKPHPEAFRAVLDALGVTDPGRAVFVGDRPFDDIFGARRSGLRTVLRPNTDVPAYDVVPDGTISGLPQLLTLVDRWSQDGRPTGAAPSA